MLMHDFLIYEVKILKKLVTQKSHDSGIPRPVLCGMIGTIDLLQDITRILGQLQNSYFLEDLPVFNSAFAVFSKRRISDVI